jgi:hypothetical protein
MPEISESVRDLFMAREGLTASMAFQPDTIVIRFEEFT